MCANVDQTRPLGWPAQASYPPVEDEKIMYDKIRKKNDGDNVCWYVKFNSQYGGKHFEIQNSSAKVVDQKEDECFSSFMPPLKPTSSPAMMLSPCQTVASQDSAYQNFIDDEDKKISILYHKCPRSRYAAFDDGNKPCTIDATKNLGGGSVPCYRYKCNICGFEWQQRRSVTQGELPIRTEADILVTNPYWLRKLGLSAKKPRAATDRPFFCGDCKKRNVFVWKRERYNIRHVCLKQNGDIGEKEFKEWKENEERKQKEKERLYAIEQQKDDNKKAKATEPSDYKTKDDIQRLDPINQKFRIITMQMLHPLPSESFGAVGGRICVSRNFLSQLFGNPKLGHKTGFHVRIRYQKNGNNDKYEATVFIQKKADTRGDDNLVCEWKIHSMNEDALALVYDISQMRMAAAGAKKRAINEEGTQRNNKQKYKSAGDAARTLKLHSEKVTD